MNAPKVKLELAALARRRDRARAATQERVPRSSHEEDHTIRSPGLADRRAGTLPTFRRIVVRMVLLGLFPALLAGALLLAGPYESQRLRATEVAMARESAPSYWLADDAAPPQTLSRIPVLWLLPGYLLMLWSCLQICALVREALAPSRLRAFATVRTEDTRRATLVFAEAKDDGDTMQAWARAARAEARLAAILQAATDLILVADAHHRIVLASGAAARAFGASGSELIGNGLDRLLAADTFAHYLAARAAAEAHPDAMPDREPALGQGRRRDGSTFPIEYSLAALPDIVNGRLYALVARDITLSREDADLHRMNHDFQAALVKEAEQRQATIARELHDAVASSLAGATLLLGAAQSSEEPAKTTALISASQQLVIQSMQQIRQIARGIMPAGQDKGALLPALEHFVADMNQLPGIRCRFCSRGDFAEVSGEAGGHLFRIVQEATNNAVRHGKASHILISLARSGNRHRLTVQDDGVGCDPRILASPLGGIGIRSMQARAEALGGVFGIAARPHGRGLRVQVTWQAARGSSSVIPDNRFLQLRT